MPKLKHFLLSALITASCIAANAQDLSSQIPDLGQPENRHFSANLQSLYGKLIYSEFYDASFFIHNPIIDDYINGLGFKLFAHVTDSRHIPRFFVINQNSINAFAYPGGTIGFHSKLIIETQTESELAGVMAHELSHVSQNHIARSVQEQARQAPLQLLTTLAAMVAASQSSNPDAVLGSMSIAQGLFAQKSINFTRSQESEADSVGIQLMEKSGFSVTGFRDFFNRLAKNHGSSLVAIPELLLTHPKPTTRIAEANARMTEENSKIVPNSLEYEIVKAILFEQGDINERPDIEKLNLSPTGKYFHQALRAYHKQPDEGIRLLKSLTDKTFNPMIHLQLAQLQLRNQQASASLSTVENALKLFPSNPLLTLFRAERLLELGKNTQVIEELLTLQETSTNPRIPHLLSRAYQAQDNWIEAYFQLATHNYSVGDYYQALYQLDNALASKDISVEQKDRIKQRYDKIYHELPDKLREQLIQANRPRNRRGY